MSFIGEKSDLLTSKTDYGYYPIESRTKVCQLKGIAVIKLSSHP